MAHIAGSVCLSILVAAILAALGYAAWATRVERRHAALREKREYDDAQYRYNRLQLSQKDRNWLTEQERLTETDSNDIVTKMWKQFLEEK